MPGDYAFEIKGLDELSRDFEKVLSKYPDQTEKWAYRQAGNFTKDVNTKFPPEYDQGKRPIAKEWHRSREKATFGGYTIGIEIQNTAPHWHLVENGHQLVINPKAAAIYFNNKSRGKSPGRSSKKISRALFKGSGKIHAGFVPGKHYCEKTREEWETTFPKNLEKFVDKMLKEENL